MTIEDRFYTDLDGNNYSQRLPKKNEQNMIELSAREKKVNKTYALTNCRNVTENIIERSINRRWLSIKF